MKRPVLLSGLLLVCASCGAPSEDAAAPKGSAAVDSVTAALRSAFSAAEVPDASLVGKLTGAKQWLCLYHAANHAAAFGGAREVTYTAQYVSFASLILEHTTSMRAGPVEFPGWSRSLAISAAGLRHDANGEENRSQVVRLTSDGYVVVEFLFQPLGFFDPSNAAVADPRRNAAGYSICTKDP